MDKLFYILYAFALINEAAVFGNPKKRLELKAKLKKCKDPGDFDTSMSTVVMFNIFYLVLTIIGLFTFQWWAFVLMILISIIPKRKAWTLVVDAFVSILIILFIVINKFHFHYSPF